MKVKKYTADTMNEAMKIVRTELGEDAVILNSKAVYSTKFFGFIKKRQVEVIAAIDEVENIEQVTEKRNHIQGVAQREKIQQIYQNKQPIINEDIEKVEIVNSLKEMKNLLQKLDLDKQKNNWSPQMLKMEKLLSQMEIPSNLVSNSLKYVLDFTPGEQLNDQKVVKEKVMEYFGNMLESVENMGRLQKKFVSLVGPTGVGKTTTLAKLAAHASLQQGKTLGFITTDTYRIGAIEQLKTYANILDAPLEVCYNAEDFIHAKEKLKHVDVIFIDTAGRNYLESKYVQDLQSIINFNEEVETYLVLSLTSKLTDMKKIANQFSSVNFDQFIFTKLDETSSCGSIIAMIEALHKGVAFVTNGQSVPEDIQPMTQAKVVKLIEEGLK
ncbi:MAG: flagellar biosynthesis protein FlhF [Bacillaceae bacterium]|nr:flagellar biosynthesis protein FlhF [Bacillaceae bacterium]